jgi:DNA modification methylase
MHPTAKPPQLIAAHILNSSQPGSVGVDPFSGYGSTLVAAEQCGRLAFCQDIDPRFVAATLERCALMGLSPTMVEIDGEMVVDAVPESVDGV